jgi:hypothetical protein
MRIVEHIATGSRNGLFGIVMSHPSQARRRPRSGVRQRPALSWGRVSWEVSEMSLAAQLAR